MFDWNTKLQAWATDEIRARRADMLAIAACEAKRRRRQRRKGGSSMLASDPLESHVQRRGNG